MPIFGQKHVNSVKTKLYYGSKKSIGCPLFTIFHEKITTLMPFLSKKRTFSKEHTLLTRIFGQKNVNFFKNTVLSCQFNRNFH